MDAKMTYEVEIEDRQDSWTLEITSEKYRECVNVECPASACWLPAGACVPDVLGLPDKYCPWCGQQAYGVFLAARRAGHELGMRRERTILDAVTEPTEKTPEQPFEEWLTDKGFEPFGKFHVVWRWRANKELRVYRDPGGGWVVKLGSIELPQDSPLGIRTQIWTAQTLLAK